MRTAIAPVLKYPGSKWNIAEWIIKHMPRHTTYLEPFFGSGAVLLNKYPSTNETVNDIDGDIANLFQIIRDRPEELAYLVQFTPWARDEYMNILTSAKEKVAFTHTGNNLEDARRFLIRCWMAFGAKTSDRTSWAHNIQETYINTTKRWNRVPENILAVALRLKDVQIENQPALTLIQRYAHPEVLIYADPPYLLSTRSRRLYRNEMTEQDHRDLLDILDNHPGPVLLSGYSNAIYENRLAHWERQTTFATTEKGGVRQEVLWINPIASRMINGYLNFDF